MTTPYDPYEKTAIRSVREDHNHALVADGCFDIDGGEPSFDPILQLTNRNNVISPGELQQRYTDDCYKWSARCSLYGGSQLRYRSPNSHDAYLNRGKS